jgi:hypothetical protein
MFKTTINDKEFKMNELKNKYDCLVKKHNNLNNDLKDKKLSEIEKINSQNMELDKI